MTLRSLTGWFNHTRFALKFAVVGLLIAGPLLVASGFALASFHARVQALDAVEGSLVAADQIRALAISVARHRGFTATVLAGGEVVSSQLVAEQRFMLPQLDRVIAQLDAPGWRQTGLPDPAGLRADLLALTQLPQGLDQGANFARHNDIVSTLLTASARLGQGLALLPERATDNDMVFVRMPMLIEEVGRQRDWGSAILTRQQATRESAEHYLLYAGATVRQQELMRADPATLARLDRLHGGLGRPVVDALNEAKAFHHRSMLAVRLPQGDDGAGGRHFADGTAVIDLLAAVNETLVAVQRAGNARDLAAAERSRALAGLSLMAVLALLFVLYREFSRSTVRRLHALGLATQQLSRSNFDQPIEVEGRDEIAQLGQSLENARLLLRQAVAERARGLAAQQADRAKTDFLARWSHDLRTPLNAVLGFAELIEGRPGARLSEAQRGDLQRIRQAGAHLLRLVNDVLDISRIEASQVDLQLAPQALPEAVAEALALLAPEAEAAAVSLHLNPGLVTASDRVLADRTRLVQILGNLVGNAIKFNRPGGRVELNLSAAGHDLVVAVVDNGQGLPPEALARLFVPFERLNATERQIEGSGLGLAVSQRLAEAMGGHIDVSSTPGEGSVFSLRLPRAHESASVAATSFPGGHAGTRPLPQGRLAYVEDNPVNALVVREMLHGIPGLTLAGFATAAEALQAVHAGERFDLWMIDKHLPDIDGVELLGELNALAQAQGYKPPVAVMLSADALPTSVAPALAAGFVDYWTKPVALHALRADLARHLAWARGEAGADLPPRLATIQGPGQAASSRS